MIGWWGEESPYTSGELCRMINREPVIIVNGIHYTRKGILLMLEQIKETEDSEEVENLKEKVESLESNCNYYESDIEGLKEEIENKKYTITNLEKEVEELENLDWEKIKEEREDEAGENVRIKRNAHKVEEHNRKLINDNKSLIKQNEDLISTIKELKHFSDRFQLMDLRMDLEVDYDK